MGEMRTLAPFKPIYDGGRLAVVHAVGSPDNTRSHFDAQDFMESATPGLKGTPDGWLNRYLTEFDVRGGPVSDTARVAFEAMYNGGMQDVLYAAGRETFTAMKMLKAANPAQYQPANGASYPRGPFGMALQQVAQLIKADIGMEIAFADADGWDTHASQGAAQGQMANRLTEFSQAIAAFHEDLGDRMRDVVLLTMSEFGRTARENGNRGTDHGHANVMFVLGGPVKGKKVYGQWPGLQPDQLFEQRDLAMTTDFREVLGEVLMRHLGLREVGPVFPGYRVSTSRFRNIL
jgi:uncharacterized protein (DUF1501 family)